MSYHTDGDVIRGIGGHSLVGPELLPKKFKERDILQGSFVYFLMDYLCLTDIFSSQVTIHLVLNVQTSSNEK